MIRSNQKWYDKPLTKLILVSIALTWMFPLFGFVLSSFRPGESIKRTSWWDAVYTGKVWSELSLQNYSEVFRAENLDRSFYNSLAVTIHLQ
jgi:ABC-type glycerol-3-phosphate transport system permease component